MNRPRATPDNPADASSNQRPIRRLDGVTARRRGAVLARPRRRWRRRSVRSFGVRRARWLDRTTRRSRVAARAVPGPVRARVDAVARGDADCCEHGLRELMPDGVSALVTLITSGRVVSNVNFIALGLVSARARRGKHDDRTAGDHQLGSIGIVRTGRRELRFADRCAAGVLPTATSPAALTGCGRLRCCQWGRATASSARQACVGSTTKQVARAPRTPTCQFWRASLRVAAVVRCGHSDASGLSGLTCHDPGSTVDRGAI